MPNTMISIDEFNVLMALMNASPASYQELAVGMRASFDSVSDLCLGLERRGLMANFKITDHGWKLLEHYKVNNAVIMAAGLSSRFAPISYEKPKGLIKVRGEVLIERQIRQLHDAGIDDITVVVGYKREHYSYLEEAFHVKIVVNPDYMRRNNNSTLMLVHQQLGNTYICSSDNYFTENVFEPYVYEAYYAAQYFSGKTDEYCLTVDEQNVIRGVEIGGEDSYGMMGHAFFDRAFSARFSKILEEEYERPETAPKLWEDVYSDHICELRMTMRAYDPGVVWEFDTLEDLCVFDPDFMDSADCSIIDNICCVVGCDRGDIRDIWPIKRGLTNLSFHFSVGGEEYVYRHPGQGTDEIVCRASEAFSQQAAKSLEIDGTYVYEDPQEGWKISTYVQGCVPFDYHNPTHVRRGFELLRRLHASGVRSEWQFDVYKNAEEIVSLLGGGQVAEFPDFADMSRRAKRLDVLVKGDGVEPVLCHNDFYDPNFLVRDDLMYLIDWEYSAMSDYASDLGTFICCSDYTEDEAEGAISVYFGRNPTFPELRHCLAYVGLSAYYWFVWALYKDACGDPMGEWLYRWHRAAQRYCERAEEMYGGERAVRGGC